MHNIVIDETQSPQSFYRDLISAAESLVTGEPDTVANMANISALIMQFVPDLNWAGFYRVIDDELVLGPFQGKSACIRIEIGKGVCGARGQDWAKRSGLPMFMHSRVTLCVTPKAGRSWLSLLSKRRKTIAVLDLDSPMPDRFSASDQAGMEALISAISGTLG